MVPQHHSITKTLIVGLSGPSSSGKTTLARLLRSIFNIPASPETNHSAITLFIIHEDDFYKTDSEIPVITTSVTGRRLQDWDCAASLDLPLLEKTLRLISANGHLPPDLRSREDENEVGESGVSEVEMRRLRGEVVAELRGLKTATTIAAAATAAAATTTAAAATISKGEAPRQEGPTDIAVPVQIQISICILEGFLLYPSPSNPTLPPSLTTLLTHKLFLRSTHSLTKSRREARAGYVTLEGFWRDPPGYVDEVVWVNYVREHGWMFEGGDVDGGAVRGEVMRREGIRVAPGRGERGMRELLGWAVGVVGEGVGMEIGGLGVRGIGNFDLGWREEGEGGHLSR